MNPQMSTMNWLLLMIYFVSLYFIVLSILVNLLYNKPNTNKLGKQTTKKLNLGNKLWKLCW